MAKGKYEYWLSPDGLTLLEAWARDGLTDVQIAHNVGIRRETLIQWKKSHSNISNALKKGKQIVDIAVENALYKKATGFIYTEQSAFKVKNVFYDTDGHRCEKEELQVIDLEKYCPPETVADIFWLKNRKPDAWRDKQPEQHASDDDEDDNLYNAIAEGVKKHEV